MNSGMLATADGQLVKLSVGFKAHNGRRLKTRPSGWQAKKMTSAAHDAAIQNGSFQSAGCDLGQSPKTRDFAPPMKGCQKDYCKYIDFGLSIAA